MWRGSDVERAAAVPAAVRKIPTKMMRRINSFEGGMICTAGTLRARGAAGRHEVSNARWKVAVEPTVGGEHGKSLGAAGASEGGECAMNAKRPRTRKKVQRDGVERHKGQNGAIRTHHRSK